MRIGPLIFSVRRASEALPEPPTLTQRVQRLEIAVLALDEKHEALAGHHMKLRNQFHGSKGGRPSAASQGGQIPLAEIPHGDKAALRRALGVVPGRPYTHQE